MKIAFLFPGQGSQIVGMGKEIYNTYPKAREIYEKASNILKKDISKLCFESMQEELNNTQNAQIAILVTSLAILEVLKEHNIQADICTGLSLGEYTALIYSGYISFDDGVKLIEKRGYYMQNELPNENFKMLAVIGLDSKIIEQVCKEIQNKGKFVVPANYNYSCQTVISGEEIAIEEAKSKLIEKGAKRLVELKSSGPFHTIKLEKAKEKFAKELEKITFNKGSIPVIKNIDGEIYSEKDNIKEVLAKHMISPVHFDKAIKRMQDEKIDLYIEIGPGKTLTGFIRKENKEAKTMNICDAASLEEVLKVINM